jgi:uncharacterized membrane protein YfcA
MLEAMHLTLSGFSLIFVSALIGALIQGSIGYGLNLVVVPVAAVVQPAALPAAMIIMALPMTAGSALLEHNHIDRSSVTWMTMGRLPGVVLGAWVVTAVTSEVLSIVVGGCVVFAALMSLSSPSVRVTRFSSVIAGLLGGAMGTTSSIGGPPVAILLQNEPGPVLRSTSGATFLIGISMSLGALILAGQVERWHWVLGIALVPAIVFGLYASRFLHSWLDSGWIRPCVLGFAGLSGLGVLVRGIL